MDLCEQFDFPLISAVDAVIEIAEVQSRHLASIILISVKRRVEVSLLETTVPFEVAYLL